MNVREYIEARAASDAAYKRLLEAIKELEERMARRAAEAIGGLDTSGGRILGSAANVAAALEVVREMQAELGADPWADAVADYLESIDATTDRVFQYAATLGTVDDAASIALRRQYKALLADMLTGIGTYAADLWVPAYQSVASAIASEATVSQAIGAVEALALGGEDQTIGAVERIVAQPVSDATAIHERATTQEVARQLNVKFYLYQGSEIDTTRPFCAARRGKVWHEAEIRAWAGEDWAGKRPETNAGNIFDLLGGYNCRHILVPLAKRDVPASDLERMRKKGLL